MHTRSKSHEGLISPNAYLRRLKHNGLCKSSCMCKIDLNKLKSKEGAADKMMEMSHLYDIDFVSSIDENGTKVSAHRVILLGLGPKFHDKFLKVPNAVVEINLPTLAIEDLVRFAYHGECNVRDESIDKMMMFANQFQIYHMLKYFSSHLLEKLGMDNAIAYFQLVERYGTCKEFNGRFKRYILQNFMDIANQSNNMADTDAAFIEHLISDDEINCTEEQLYHFLVLWMRAKGDLDCEKYGHLFKNVRWSLMSTEYFRNNVDGTARIEGQDIAMAHNKYIENAKLYFSQQDKVGSLRRKIADFQFHRKDTPRIPSEVVFAIGGWGNDPNGPSSVVEIYDARTRAWTRMNSLPTSRAYATACVCNGKVYVIGGYDGNDYLSSMAVYDTTTDTWEERAPMYDNRCYISATEMNGKIYSVGGYDGKKRLNSLEFYDPKKNNWSRLAHMQLIRSDACAVSHPNGKLYVMGGFTGEEILNSTEIYDPSSDTWSFGPPMNSIRSGLKAIVYNGKIFVIGGFDGHHRLNTVEILDPSKDIPCWEQGPQLNKPRSNFSATLLGDKILVSGGFNDHDGVIDGSEIYCQKLKQWTLGTPMIMRRSALSLIACKTSLSSSSIIDRTT